MKHFEEEHSVTPCKLEIKELKHAFRIWQYKVFEAAGAFLTAAIVNKDGKINLFWECIKCIFEFSQFDYRILYFSLLEIKQKDKSFYKGLDVYNKIKERLDEILDDNSILILPTLPEPAPHPLITIPKLESIGYTGMANILGLPATSIPAGLSQGLPIAVQVLAKNNNDHLTLAAAVELDKVFGGWRSPCPISL